MKLSENEVKQINEAVLSKMLPGYLYNGISEEVIDLNDFDNEVKQTQVAYNLRFYQELSFYDLPITNDINENIIVMYDNEKQTTLVTEISNDDDLTTFEIIRSIYNDYGRSLSVKGFANMCSGITMQDSEDLTPYEIFDSGSISRILNGKNMIEIVHAVNYILSLRSNLFVALSN
ncbi:hypothetical protein ACYATP_00160 [Lactobacillaceae bacterium Melli_B4]